MAELRLRDRLQPSLLDRLTDRGRLNTRIRLHVLDDAARQHGISPAEIGRALLSRGFVRLEPETAIPGSTASASSTILEFGLIGAVVQLSALQAIVLSSDDRTPSIRLVDVANIDVSVEATLANVQDDGRTLGMKELRQAVLRDLAWLLNATNLEGHESLQEFPAVMSAVVNYGTASVAGRNQSAADAKLVADSIRRAIQRFEPRLTRVNVMPESEEDLHSGIQSFRLEAELWGQPVPQHLSLRTTLDFDRSTAAVVELGGT